ncbi:hypothetical protein CRUP_009870 [Coryphaenoides rupestris]|nr:hypothetical protein CRUP_009870 [Coryphaenoides rupestris]
MMAAVRRHPPNTSKGLFSSIRVHMAHGLFRGPTDPQLCVALSPGKPPRLTMSRAGSSTPLAVTIIGRATPYRSVTQPRTSRRPRGTSACPSPELDQLGSEKSKQPGERGKQVPVLGSHGGWILSVPKDGIGEPSKHRLHRSLAELHVGLGGLTPVRDDPVGAQDNGHFPSLSRAEMAAIAPLQLLRQIPVEECHDWLDPPLDQPLYQCSTAAALGFPLASPSGNSLGQESENEYAVTPRNSSASTRKLSLATSAFSPPSVECVWWSQTEGPFPSRSQAPSVWKADVPVAQRNPGGKVSCRRDSAWGLGLGFTLGCCHSLLPPPGMQATVSGPHTTKTRESQMHGVRVRAEKWFSIPGKSFSTATIIIDLSSKNLSVVPGDLPSSAEYIDLSLNHIRQLGPGDFADTPRLRFLNLSGNGLEEIDPGVFSRTPLLGDLDLSHNSLRNLSDQLYLDHTKHLRALNLAFNMFFTMRLGEQFRTLEMLQSLALGGNTNIQMDDFENIAGVKLHTLTLFRESGATYAAGSLDHVQAQRLQIVPSSKRPTLWTRDGLFKDALRLFDELELSGLADDYLEAVKLLREEGEIRTSRLYLTNIVIQWKDFTDFVNAVLQSNVTHLSITDVTFLRLPYHDTYVSNTSAVKSFILARATVISVFFSQNAMYNFFINMPVASAAVVETPIIHMTCPSSQSPLRQLDFSNCALSDTIFSREEGEHTLECETLGQLSRLSLRGNNLKDFQKLSMRMQNMTSLKYLDLSLNGLTHDGQVECTWPSSLTHVNLSSNQLTHFVFTCLPRGTKELDLQNNEVSVVPQGPFLRLDSLEILDLSSNRLKDLPDADWVKDSLLHNLQGPAGGRLRICHHEKSFLPGRTIIENIMQCVEKSWRCVFVLSSHFVKSEWCHYELYFASHQHLAWGSDRVVLVLLEPLPEYLIPSKYHQLKNLMSKHIYLEWPEEKAKQGLFWANLRAALQADLLTAPPEGRGLEEEPLIVREG